MELSWLIRHGFKTPENYNLYSCFSSNSLLEVSRRLNPTSMGKNIFFWKIPLELITLVCHLFSCTRCDSRGLYPLCEYGGDRNTSEVFRRNLIKEDNPSNILVWPTWFSEHSRDKLMRIEASATATPLSQSTVPSCLLWEIVLPGGHVMAWARILPTACHKTNYSCLSEATGRSIDFQFHSADEDPRGR